jgi:adenylate cyclase
MVRGVTPTQGRTGRHRLSDHGLAGDRGRCSDLRAAGPPGWSLKLVILIAALGFPIALALAWAFDVTPRGIERSAKADPTHPVPTGDTAAAARPIATPAAAGAASSLPSSRADQSVAIMPFVDMSAERDQDYFCDGVAEEIGNALCYVRGLKVAARTSAFQFKGKSADVREIGRTLGVDTIRCA